MCDRLSAYESTYSRKKLLALNLQHKQQQQQRRRWQRQRPCQKYVKSLGDAKHLYRMDLIKRTHRIFDFMRTAFFAAAFFFSLNENQIFSQ